MSKNTDVLAGSHLPLLIKLMERVDKPVLELGIGWNSTPLLHWLCKKKGLNLISLESDLVWLEKFQEFSGKFHTVGYFDFMDWEQTFLADKKISFGMVFVDHRPARKRRSSALYFKDRANYIVLHDSELADDPAYKYRSVYDKFKYKFEYKAVGKPHTIVLSNKKDLSWLTN